MKVLDFKEEYHIKKHQQKCHTPHAVAALIKAMTPKWPQRPDCVRASGFTTSPQQHVKT